MSASVSYAGPCGGGLHAVTSDLDAECRSAALRLHAVQGPCAVQGFLAACIAVKQSHHHAPQLSGTDVRVLCHLERDLERETETGATRLILVFIQTGRSGQLII